MTSIIISGKNKKDVDAIAVIAQKIGVNVHRIDSGESEDLLLGALMQRVKTNKMVAKNTVLKQLMRK